MAHGHANRAAVKQAMYDVITRHFNGQLATDQALNEFAAAVEERFLRRNAGRGFLEDPARSTRLPEEAMTSIAATPRREPERQARRH